MSVRHWGGPSFPIQMGLDRTFACGETWSVGNKNWDRVGNNPQFPLTCPKCVEAYEDYEKSILGNGATSSTPAPTSPSFTGVPVSGNKPMVTAEEYQRARRVLDALPPGYYVKCKGCGNWWTKGEFLMKGSNDGPYCERCK